MQLADFRKKIQENRKKLINESPLETIRKFLSIYYSDADNLDEVRVH